MDNLIGASNSQKAETPVAFLTIGDTRKLELRFTTNGTAAGSSPNIKRVVSLEDNTLSELPSSDETIYMRHGGDKCPYSPETPTEGCWMHGVPLPVKSGAISMGYGFRNVLDTCQVDMATDCVRWDSETWIRYSKATVKYQLPRARNKREYHQQVNLEWAKHSEDWSKSVQVKVLDAVGKWIKGE